MNIWTVIGLATVITFALRAVFLVGNLGGALPLSARRALELIPTAALGSLVIASALVTNGGTSLTVTRALALLVAAWVSHRTANVFFTIAGGMTVIWLAALLG